MYELPPAPQPKKFRFLTCLTWTPIILIAVFGAIVLAQGAISGSDVTLHAAPGNSKVQMFATLKDGLDAKVYTFRDGFRCEKISDLIRVGEGETAMFFYKLDCAGQTGYVNADWVR